MVTIAPPSTTPRRIQHRIIVHKQFSPCVLKTPCFVSEGRMGLSSYIRGPSRSPLRLLHTWGPCWSPLCCVTWGPCWSPLCCVTRVPCWSPFSHSELTLLTFERDLAPVSRLVRPLGLFEVCGLVEQGPSFSVPGALGTPPEVWFAEHQGCKVGAHRPHPLTAPLASGKPGVAGAQVQRAHCSCIPAPGSPYLHLYSPSGCLYIFLRVPYFLPACPYRLSLHLPAGSLLSARVGSTLPSYFPPLLPSYPSLGWLVGFFRLPCSRSLRAYFPSSLIYESALHRFFYFFRPSRCFLVQIFAVCFVYL